MTEVNHIKSGLYYKQEAAENTPEKLFLLRYRVDGIEKNLIITPGDNGGICATLSLGDFIITTGEKQEATMQYINGELTEDFPVRLLSDRVVNYKDVSFDNMNTMTATLLATQNDDELKRTYIPEPKIPPKKIDAQESKKGNFVCTCGKITALAFTIAFSAFAILNMDIKTRIC